MKIIIICGKVPVMSQFSTGTVGSGLCGWVGWGEGLGMLKRGNSHKGNSVRGLIRGVGFNKGFYGSRRTK